MPLNRILVFGPRQRVDPKSINRLKRFRSKSLGRDRAAIEIPKEHISDVCLCFAQNLDAETRHRTLGRALASAQEWSLLSPLVGPLAAP